MSKFKIQFLAGFVFTLLLLMLVGFLWRESVKNRYIDINNQYTKQQNRIETFHDTMWKTIKQSTNVTDKAKESFKEMYIPLMEGRYSHGGGQMMQWIKENNPQFDFSLFKHLMVQIESLRKQFFNEQDMMQAIVKEGNDLIEKFPTNYVLDDKPEFVFTPISSTVSKEVMKTRVDDDISL
jgi:hypothetical protein